MHPATPVIDHVAMGLSVSFKERRVDLDDRMVFLSRCICIFSRRHTQPLRASRVLVERPCRVLKGARLAGPT